MTQHQEPSEESEVAHAGVLTRERVTTIALLALTALGLYLCYLIAYPFLPALTWALALAVIARPVHHWIARRVKWRGVAAGISVTLVALLLLAPVVLVTWQIVSQATYYAQHLQEVQQKAQPVIERKVQRIGPLRPALNWVRQNVPIEQTLQRAAAGIGQNLTATVRGTLWVTVQLFITLLFLFFLFRDERQAIEAVKEYMPLTSSESREVLRKIDDTIHATIYGTILVGVVQGTLGGLMFWWLGLPAPVLWGAVMALMAVIPYLGAFVIWGPAAIWLAMQGDWGKAAILTAWGSIVVGLIDNLLYPIFVGKRLRQHTMVAFFAILGGIAVFGMSGIVLGPVIVTTTAGLIDIWWKRTRRGQAADG
jgi:predicted PurR-regulated permease PerM